MTYANQLTILRMILVPLFLGLIAYGFPVAALAVFVFAGISDVADGYIARNWPDQKSELGEVLDPVADKVLLMTSFLALTIQRDVFDLRIPLWLAIAVIGRDLLLVVAGLIIRLTVGKRRFPPSLLGKRTTFFQLLTVFLVLLSSLTPIHGLLFLIVCYVTLALTVISGLDYSIRGVRIIKRHET
ncbi:MAG TPA: CDP-alcohol phosphatidyltransferase family protein [Acidobacteriota bacterium]|nr:CDP-alcohol phosphatidyltransferase family protein [Acidobacteriota bacterium]